MRKARQTADSEGYVKYSASHIQAPAVETPYWAELNDARTRLHELGLVGINPQGIGFGNVSVRVKGEEFLISGTATGAAPVLSPDEYCLVVSFNIDENSIISSGPIRASSESMTHGAVYRAVPSANCVIHIHSRAIFDGMLRDHYPATPPEAEYGTPEIARAAGACAAAQKSGGGLIVLAGHDEGVIAFGASAGKTFALIEELNNKYGVKANGG
ncbi:MAG: class II aldolase/adducin family protein [Treponema sp.]|jgi:ribulose-5-phosphate 4-epimerase/fuculose-1-phosphate aldolase|nr:class II aldolase/adducin family protein [Treponema sp.]